MESALIDSLLPLFRGVADRLAGTPLADEAETDLRSLEAIVSRHTANLEAEALDWAAGRLHPASVQPPAE